MYPQEPKRRGDIRPSVRAAAVLLLAAVWGISSPVGCERESASRVQTESAVRGAASRQDEPVYGGAVRASEAGAVSFSRRLAIAAAADGGEAGGGPLPEDLRVAGAVGGALAARGLNVAVEGEAGPGDLLVDLRYAFRAGAMWGGIPSREILLEFQLLDERSPDPLALGWEHARYAEPSAEKAAAGALNKASGRLADRVIRALANLPEPYRSTSSSDEKPMVRAEAVRLSLACLPFRNATGNPGLNGWCDTLALVAAGECRASEQYRLLERARLLDIVDDQDVAAVLGGAADAARRVGGEIGADLLVVGEAAVRPDGSLVVTARLVRAATAEVEQVVIASGRPDQVDALEAEFRRAWSRPARGWISERRSRLRREPLHWPADDR